MFRKNRIKSYDLNGNIKGIERKGSLSNWNTDIIDNLTYYYNGNQLIAVDDAVLTNNGYDFYDNANFFNGTIPEYEYDANGNVIKDANKGIIGITYNHMNLPKEVYFSKDSKLDYYYDATGNKLRQDVIEAKILTKRTDFISNFVIVNNAPAWINFDEGRVIMDGTTVHFTETHLKDHLGNTRVVFGYKNNALAVKQVNSYYPFGMNIKGLTTRVTVEEAKHPANEYLYNGKMFQDELGLDWLDYGARMYDAQLGRWHSVDPLAEVARRWSPYTYCYNNPIRFIDPDGMLVDEYELNTETGEMNNVKESENDVVYAVNTNEDGSTTRTGEKVEFDGKPITDVRNRGNSEEGKPRQIIGVSNTDDGEKLFDFIKTQTGESQEWSILNYSENNETPQSLISTSGLRSTDPDGAAYTQQKAMNPDNLILKSEHNHPVGDASHMSSDGDRAIRDAILKNNPYAKVNIHYKENKKWTWRSILNDTKTHNDGKTFN